MNTPVHTAVSVHHFGSRVLPGDAVSVVVWSVMGSPFESVHIIKDKTINWLTIT